jgi:HAD superfamily hydrolase (TIGR01509 family)
MQIDAVLFDLFDTLVLIDGGEAYYEPCLEKMYAFLAQNGINVSFEEFKRVYFEIREKSYSESRKSLEEPHFNVRVSQTLQRLGYNYNVSNPVVVGATDCFAEEFANHVRVDPEAIDILQKLYSKYRLGLVSNFSLPECGRKLLEKFGLTRFFDAIVISGEINQRKPSPKIFLEALSQLEVEASRAVFVGDMVDLDVVGPKGVGIKTVLIRRGFSEGGSDAEPNWIIKSLNELVSLLEQTT